MPKSVGLHERLLSFQEIGSLHSDAQNDEAPNVYDRRKKQLFRSRKHVLESFGSTILCQTNPTQHIVPKEIAVPRRLCR